MIHDIQNAQITQKQMSPIYIYIQSWKGIKLFKTRNLSKMIFWFVVLVVPFFLDSKYFTDIWKTLFNELQSIDENNLNHSVNEIVELLLYGNNKYNLQQNFRILKSPIKFIEKSKRVVDWRFTSIFLNVSI